MHLFESFVIWAREQFQIVLVPDLLERIPEEREGKPFCAISFNDGWRDNFLYALPLLQQYQVPATVFLTVDLIGTDGRFWQERLYSILNRQHQLKISDDVVQSFNRRFLWYPPLSRSDFTCSRLRQILLERSSEEAGEFVGMLESCGGSTADYPDRSFLNWDEVAVMRQAGIQFGSHTLNHTLLTHAAPDVAWKEIHDSRRKLEHNLGEPVAGFSYPLGHTSARISQLVQDAGYSYALTTKGALFSNSGDPFRLPCVPISNSSIEDPLCKLASEYAKCTVTAGLLRTQPTPKERQRRKWSAGRLRIAFVINGIHGWNAGGTERQLAQMIASLDRSHFEPELFVLQKTEGLKPESLPFPARHVGNPVGALRPRVVWELRRELARFRPLIVHAFFTDAILAASVAARCAGIPVFIQSRRGLATMDQPLLKRLLLRFANHLTTNWQCNSYFIAASIHEAERIPQKQIEILPNMVDTENFRPSTADERRIARQTLGLPVDVPIFISIANLRPMKDHHTLISAAHLLRYKLADAIFLIIGEGSLERDLRAQLLKLQLDESVWLLGARPDVRPWLAAADIGITTSRSEGSSNAVLEYMSAGLPTVVSDILPNRELADGLFFEPGNSLELANQMLLLWHNEELRQALCDSHLKIAKSRNPEAIGRRLRSFYARLAS